MENDDEDQWGETIKIIHAAEDYRDSNITYMGISWSPPYIYIHDIPIHLAKDVNIAKIIQDVTGISLEGPL